jgi:TolB-like protein
VIGWQQWVLFEASRALDVLGEPQRTEWPRIVVVPFENLSTERALDSLAASVTEEVMVRLDELDLFVIASQASWYGPSPAGGSVGAGAGGGYVLTGSVRGNDAHARITVRLIEAGTGAQLWSAAYDEPLAIEQLPALHEQVARDVAAIAAPYGPIFEAELARARRAAHTPQLRDCFVTYYDYRRRIDAATHKDALLCFQTVSERKPRVAQVWAGLAMLHLDEYAFRFSPGDQPLVSARRAAAEALALDRNDFLGNLAQTRVQFFDGDPAFRRSIETTLALRPDSAEALVQGGILLTITGDSASGLPLVERARTLSKAPPGLYNLAYAVTYLREGKFDEALACALKIDAPNWVVAQSVLAAAAALSGREDIARAAAKRVLELQPAFESRGLDDMERWHFDRPLYDVFVSGLKAAGLDLHRRHEDPKAPH